MSGIKRNFRFISFVLVAALLWAPVLPAFVFVSHAGDAHSGHIFNDNGETSVVLHADPKQSPCSQHDFCNGQCCDSCVQCASATSFVYRDYLPLHPVQTSVLTQLHPLVVATTLDRPPRIR
jgi:hypothetical protein